MIQFDQHLRPRIDLRDGWRYVDGRRSRAWLAGRAPGDDERTVQLPHSWNTTDTYEIGARYRQGWGSYRCLFPFAVEGRETLAWRLRSEGFYGTGDVWLNGTALASVDGQYLGLDVPAGVALRGGTNVLAVRLNNRYHRHVLPGIRHPDFLLHGGLAGRVWFEGVPMVHLVESETWVTCATVDARMARVVIPFALRNLSVQRREVRLTWRLRDPAGACVAEDTVGVSLPPGLTGTFVGQMQFTVDHPQLWSPDAPRLYEAQAELSEGDAPCDGLRIRFGCRSAAFTPTDGFLLNGERLDLRGVNRHESMPGLGNAVPEGLHRADVRQMRALGLNFVRLSHYPQHPAFLDACDELGLLVYAELASWKSVRTGGWLRAARRQMESLVRRDRHRPCVIVWGMGNEARSRRAYLDLRARITALDPTRVVTYAENHLYRARRQRTLGIPDVWGCNYELEALEAARDAARLKTVLVTECSNYPPAVRGQLAEEAQQVALIASDLARLRDRPYVAGFALWSFADYATLRKARYHRCCGVVDAWRLPKMAADYLRATGLRTPVLAVHGDWTAHADQGATRRVYVFSNLTRLTIRVNGSVWRELADARPFQPLDVPFLPGVLSVEGEGGGVPIVSQLETPGPAVGLDLRDDPAFRADPDLARVEVHVVDGEQRLVSDWCGWASVSLEGAGSVVCHVPDSRIPIAAGRGVVFIRRPPAGGPIRLQVTAGTFEAIAELPDDGR